MTSEVQAKAEARAAAGDMVMDFLLLKLSGRQIEEGRAEREHDKATEARIAAEQAIAEYLMEAPATATVAP